MLKSRITGPRIVGFLIVLALAIALWFMLRKPALEVDVAQVSRGPMVVTIDDLGETRVRNLYTVSAPVTGELLRLAFKPGASVSAGAVVAEIQPIQPAPLDRRSYDEALARVGVARAELAAARARTQQARASERLAAANFHRYETLVAKGFVSRAQFDAARADMESTRAASQSALQSEQAAGQSLQVAEAGLRVGAGPIPGGRAISVRAPVSGVVLSLLHESGGPVAASTPLLEIGDPAELEVFSEMLSADAVKVLPGAAVDIEGWGGDQPLKGRVRLVEPLGFRKISALGVEEQRVKVVIDLVDPHSAWQRLGHGYRVGVRIALWSAPEVLQVPIGALFRQGNGWAAFVLGKDGRARLQAVRIGHSNDEAAEVLGGLEPGQSVIVHPGEKVRDGVRVRAMSS